IPALHGGQPVAYNTIFHHFIDPVRHFIGQIVKDGAVTEDIAVEAFTRVFERKSDFASIDKLKGFLFITAGNMAKDFLRRENFRGKVIEQFRAESTESWEEEAEAAYIKAEALRIVREVVLKIPGQAGQVLRMMYLEGKKIPEISAELGIAYNTVQNHRAKGLQLVREQLSSNPLLTAAALQFALYLLEI
ncbi:MAG: sigma-70 family RNA polymerase sigma factor, partial [Chitinophagaceae bacterium]|nr:sigma-70 family RNA polymerase sigma factor [Chitinophagaceae bacterium]